MPRGWQSRISRLREARRMGILRSDQKRSEEWELCEYRILEAARSPPDRPWPSRQKVGNCFFGDSDWPKMKSLKILTLKALPEKSQPDPLPWSSHHGLRVGWSTQSGLPGTFLVLVLKLPHSGSPLSVGHPDSKASIQLLSPSSLIMSTTRVTTNLRKAFDIWKGQD